MPSGVESEEEQMVKFSDIDSLAEFEAFLATSVGTMMAGHVAAAFNSLYKLHARGVGDDDEESLLELEAEEGGKRPTLGGVESMGPGG